VLERQIEELPLLDGHFPVPALADRLVGERVRDRIGRERLCRAAIDVARELIEHNDRREQRARIVPPTRRPGRRELVAQVLEPPLAFRIQPVVAREALLRRHFLQPEVQNRVRHRMDLAPMRP
jgi:hypothetical protein